MNFMKEVSKAIQEFLFYYNAHLIKSNITGKVIVEVSENDLYNVMLEIKGNFESLASDITESDVIDLLKEKIIETHMKSTL